jgi:uncharacterized membrane protein YwaF
MLNLVFLVHALLAIVVAVFAIGSPDLLVQIATFTGSSSLQPEGKLMTRFFGVCLFLVAALAWGARGSGSAPARRMTAQVFMAHLLLGAIVALVLLLLGPVFFYTVVLILILCVLFFLAYWLIWVFVPSEF